MKSTQLQGIAVAVLLAAVVQVLITVGAINAFWELVIQLACITTVAALGLNIIYGFNGQFSLGHIAFYGLGAYASALVTKGWTGTNPLGFLLAIVVGGLVAAGVAFLVGVPILRLRSDYLGIATLGFGFLAKVAFDNADSWIPMLGGSRGMTGIPKMTSFIWVAAITILAVVVMRNFVYSSHGRATMSIREDEIAASAMGVDTTRYKTIAFVMGCFFAGVAGALYAHLFVFLHPTSFDFLKSIDMLLIVVLGGLGSITGTIIAAVGWTFFLQGLTVVLPQEILDWRFVIYPLLLIVVMLWRPGGLLGSLELWALKAPKIRKRIQGVTAEG
jgi:branched-chain amino acid transport system permease protein